MFLYLSIYLSSIFNSFVLPEVIVSLEQDSIVVSESNGSLSLTVQKLGEADVDIIMMLTAEPNSAVGMVFYLHCVSKYNVALEWRKYIIPRHGTDYRHIHCTFF